MTKSRLDVLLEAQSMGIDLVYLWGVLGTKCVYDDDFHAAEERRNPEHETQRNDPFFRSEYHDGFWLHSLGSQVARITKPLVAHIGVYDRPVRLRKCTACTYSMLAAYMTLDLVEPIVTKLIERFGRSEINNENARKVDWTGGTDYDRKFSFVLGNLLRLNQIDEVELNAAVDLEMSQQLRESVEFLEREGDVGFMMTALQHEHFFLFRRFPKMARKQGRFLDIAFIPNGLRRKGYKPVDFGNRANSYKLVCELYFAKDEGLSRTQLLDKLYPRRAVNASNLDQAKTLANELLKQVNLEIVAEPNHWHLAELRS